MSEMFEIEKYIIHDNFLTVQINFFVWNKKILK